jgi:hypothetical protein
MAMPIAQENIGYMFQYGTGVPSDYVKAMSWFVKAAAQGHSDTENQIGWMYQFGQGVEPDDGYGLSADQRNMHGKNNLQAFTNDLEYRADGVLESAQSSVTDAAIALAQRWANIQDLHNRIDKAEVNALYNDDIVDQLEHTGKGKNDAITKLFNAVGSVGAINYRLEAEKYRAQAASLRDELARIESQ